MIGTANVIQACVEQNVQRLVYTSTVDVVIGRRHDVISAGDESLPVPRRFLFPGYADSKRKAELLVFEANGRALAKGECSDSNFFLARWRIVADENRCVCISVKNDQIKAKFVSDSDCNCDKK